MSALQVIVPLTIDQDSQLVSSSAVESADATWVATPASYSVNATVKYLHRRYKCIQAYTTQTYYPNASGSAYWLDIGPTNVWAMFDSETSTTTTSTGSMTVAVKPSKGFDSVAVLGVTGCSSVTLTLKVPDDGYTTAIYTKTVTLDSTFVGNWYDYFYTAFDTKTEVVFTNIPNYLYGRATITLTASSGGTTVACAAFVLGTYTNMGAVQYGAVAGILDYSVKNADSFGVTTLVKRNFAKRVNYSLWISNSQIRRVFSTLAELRATPCVWVGSDDYTYSPLVVFGFYKDFGITVAYPDFSTCSLEIEGMT